MGDVSLVDGHIDNRMSDEDIIRQLKEEIRIAKTLDRECCYNVKVDLIKDTLDLINRQKEENERLQAMHKEMCVGMKVLKRKAIKEFAERLKEKLLVCNKRIDGAYVYEISNEDIDNLVKEMVGEQNE